MIGQSNLNISKNVKKISKKIVNKILASKQHLDQGDGEVVRGGVEPLDRGHHAAVVHCAQELRLATKNMIRLSLHHLKKVG